MAKRTNYIKTKIYNTQQNSKCILCGDRDEIVKLILSELNNPHSKRKSQRLGALGMESDPLGIVQEIKIRPHLKNNIWTNYNPS